MQRYIDKFKTYLTIEKNASPHTITNYISDLEDFASQISDKKIEDIDYCFVSHEHLDHCGLLKFFKRKNPDLQILMHKTTDESLRFGSNSNYFGRMERNAMKIITKMEIMMGYKKGGIRMGRKRMKGITKMG